MGKAVKPPPRTKKRSNTRAVGETGVRPVSPLGVLASVFSGGECSNTHNPGKTYSKRQEMQKNVACSFRTGSNTYKTETTANVTSNASNNIYYLKYIEDSYLVPHEAYTCKYTGICPVTEHYKTATDNANVYAKWSDTAEYVSDLICTAIHPAVSDDKSHIDSCSTVSDDGINISVDIGRKDTYHTMSYGNSHRGFVDRIETIDNTNGCTRTLTNAEVLRLSEIGQYENENTLCVTSQTIDATEACSNRSMFNQDLDVYTQNDYEKPDAKLTTVDEETEQCEAIGWNTGHQGTTLEDYGATSHHCLEMECETPEPDHDSEDEAHCCSEPSTSEYLLLDHPYGVYSMSTSDRKAKALQCHHCGIVSNNYRLHIAHIRTHFIQNMFHCDKCCESRANKTNPGIHKARNSAGHPLCKLCGKLLANGPPKLTCKQCGETYTSSSRYPRHTCRRKGKYKVTKHNTKPARKKETITEYTCQQCNKSFSKHALLKMHVRIHSVDNYCKCDVCGKVYSSPGNLKNHRLIHTDRLGHVCAVCGKIFKRKVSLKTHMLLHEGKKNFSCGECGKRFFIQFSLTRHSLVHSGVKAHQCDTCGATFGRLDGLKHHVLVNHDGVKRFTCEICQRAFSSKAGMIVHTRTHTGDRPFSCTACGKKFTQKQSMDCHMKTHTGERPFSCTTCGKTLSSKQSLDYHTRLHTGERPFPCTTCGKKCVRKQDLVTHSRTCTRDIPSACNNGVHSESLQGQKQLTCSHCSRTFATKQHLGVHMRRHVRIYSCTICPRSFDTETALDTHGRRHTSSRDRPFVCIFCGNTFRTRAALTIHYGRIHK